MAKKHKKLLKRATKAAPKRSSFGIQPLGDGVVIKPEAAETKTASGIYIPDTAKQEKSTIGRVVAVGTGRRTDDGKILPMNVKVGEKVYFNPGWENEIEWKGEKYFLVHESDIRGILS